ncbi:MAG: hypothetical protein Q7R93_01885 [bacterium]|nr:hypothetical protein [bacterium]
MNTDQKPNVEEHVPAFVPRPLTKADLPPPDPPPLQVGDVVVPKFTPIDDSTHTHQIKTLDPLTVIKVNGAKNNRKLRFADTRGEYLDCFFKKPPS